MRVSIIGAGYVGLVSGTCLAEVGHNVMCVDIDVARVDAINAAIPPIHEDGLTEMMERNVGVRLRATTDLAAAVADSELTMIAVGTPFDGDRIDLHYVEQAAEQIGRALATKDGYHVVIVKSTVVPGTTEGVVRAALERGSGKRAGDDFGLGMNPEFLREGEAIVDFMDPDRIVFGGIDERTRDVLADLYAPFPNAEIVRTSPSTAEMIKYTANSLLATAISFSNEIGNLCAAVGVDVTEALRGVHLDRRLTPKDDNGKRVIPGFTSYLWAGCGFGGSCFPKDVRALIRFGEDHGSPMQLLRSVMEINDAQPPRMIDLVQRHLPDLAGRAVTVLGVAFKPGTDDIRESPGIAIAQALADAGAEVTVHDPIAADAARKVLPPSVRYVDALGDAVAGTEAICVTTSWGEYRGLADVIAHATPVPLVVDGRRFLDPASFQRYEAIGR